MKADKKKLELAMAAGLYERSRCGKEIRNAGTNCKKCRFRAER